MIFLKIKKPLAVFLLINSFVVSQALAQNCERVFHKLTTSKLIRNYQFLEEQRKQNIIYSLEAYQIKGLDFENLDTLIKNLPHLWTLSPAKRIRFRTSLKKLPTRQFYDLAIILNERFSDKPAYKQILAGILTPMIKTIIDLPNHKDYLRFNVIKAIKTYEFRTGVRLKTANDVENNLRLKHGSLIQLEGFGPQSKSVIFDALEILKDTTR